jgi:hypothetical protein
VDGAPVVGACVVGASVVGASVEGTSVVSASVVGAAIVGTSLSRSSSSRRHCCLLQTVSSCPCKEGATGKAATWLEPKRKYPFVLQRASAEPTHPPPDRHPAGENRTLCFVSNPHAGDSLTATAPYKDWPSRTSVFLCLFWLAKYQESSGGACLKQPSHLPPIICNPHPYQNTVCEMRTKGQSPPAPGAPRWC